MSDLCLHQEPLIAQPEETVSIGEVSLDKEMRRPITLFQYVSLLDLYASPPVHPLELIQGCQLPLLLSWQLLESLDTVIEFVLLQGYKLPDLTATALALDQQDLVSLASLA